MTDVDVAMTDDLSFSTGSSFVPTGLLSEDPFVPNGLLLNNVNASEIPLPDQTTQGAIFGIKSCYLFNLVI